MKRGNDNESGNLKLNIIIIGEWESVTKSSVVYELVKVLTVPVSVLLLLSDVFELCVMHISYVCMLSSFNLYTVGYSNTSYSIRSSYVCSVTVL